MQADGYFIHLNGRESGPYFKQQLLDMMDDNKINPHTKVRSVHSQVWVRLAIVLNDSHLAQSAVVVDVQDDVQDDVQGDVQDDGFELHRSGTDQSGTDWKEHLSARNILIAVVILGFVANAVFVTTYHGQRAAEAKAKADAIQTQHQHYEAVQSAVEAARPQITVEQYQAAGQAYVEGTGY